MKALTLALVFSAAVFSSYAQIGGTLVLTNAIWKYLVTSTRPVGDWTQAGYTDGTWPSGMAELGYGDGDESTTIGWGSDVNNKNITTYFRTKFNVSNPTEFRFLVFELTYDDGAVVYLNGSELYRVNMPEGPISQSTAASMGADYAVDARLLPATGLVGGENVLAVEVHQNSPASGDLSFALGLRGAMRPVISITSPTNNATFTPPVTFTLSAAASDPDGSVAHVQFFDGNFFLGHVSSPPFSIGVSNVAAGLHVLTARATDNNGLISTSAAVAISVDDPGPVGLLVAAARESHVQVHFSKAVAQPSATALENYNLSPPVTIQLAYYGAASNIIELITSPLAPGATYMLTVNNVQDLTGNVIAPNSQITFEAIGFESRDVGFPLVGGLSVLVPGGYDVSGTGTDIGGTTDQFQFNYEDTRRIGDFDVQVRVAGFPAIDVWAKAALMARETLDGNSRFGAAVATPSMGGSFFAFRSITGALGTNIGAGPATFPNMWLRLKRDGDKLSGFMSADGTAWAPLGSATFLNLSPELYVGMAVTSHRPTQPATAQFRDFSPVTGGTIGRLKLNREPLGPASRRTGLVISEIYYVEMACRYDDDDGGFIAHPHELIEIYNSNPYFEDLSGYRLAGNISYVFPAGTRLEGGSFLVLRPGQYSNSLGCGKSVRLLDKAGAILLEVAYKNYRPWPLASETGHSIVLSRPSYGQNNPGAWSLSDARGGSPGADEPLLVRATDALRINELNSGSGTSIEYSVELYNHGNVDVDVSQHVLQQRDYRMVIPQGLFVPANGFLSLQSAPWGGATYLLTPDSNHIVDAVSLPGKGPFGRYPDGADQFYPLSCSTVSLPNCPPVRSQVVISEIMYAPITGRSEDEYIELYNRGSSSVDVGGWQIESSSGIEYAISSPTILAPSNYLVVAKDPQHIIGRYGYLTSANVVGGFEGELEDDGERIVLGNSAAEIVDEVTYGVGGQWGNWSRGGGSSLELKDPRSDGRFAHNWADSDERWKGVWTTIEGIGSMGETLGGVSSISLYLLLLGAGECLVDDVEVRNFRGTGPNLITNNPAFEAGTNGWSFQGSHDHSTITLQGFNGTRSLHLRAAAVGDNGPSRVRSSMLGTPPTGEVLLRARVRWIRGSPDISLRVQGGGWEVSGHMEIEPNGTPGQRNSRAEDNIGPAITEVSHEPLLPAANEPVRVMARASDPDAPVALWLYYRLEPFSLSLNLPMLDNGLGGDAVAGDGIYTATVPGQPAGARIGFFVEAWDRFVAGNRFPQDVFPTPPYDRVFPTDAHNRECIVRWGESVMPGTFATYHLWLNATNTARWSNRRPLMNDTPLDATFVYNNSRVIYNVRPAYHSSPWHRGQRTTGPDGAQRIDYSVEFPSDDQFMGAKEALWINPGNPGNTTTSDLGAQAESAANTILRGAGLQNNYQRYVHVFVNGSRRSMAGTQLLIMQDAQRPNSDTVDQWSPGDHHGDLIWLEDWFEYPDNGDDFVANNDADLIRREIMRFSDSSTVLGLGFHMGAYRFMFRPADLAPGESANDYSALFGLLNAVTPTNDAPIRLSAIEPVIDYKQWMRMLAAQHAFGNWDTYGYDRGRNAYMYRSSGGRVQLWAWKNNFTLGTGGHAPTTDIFGTTDPRIIAMWREPTIARAYWQGFYELIHGPFSNQHMDPILDARAAALRDNIVGYSLGPTTIIKNFIRDRRNYLGSRLAAATNAPLAAVSTSTNGNVLTLRGTAPIQVDWITINGARYPISWSSVSNTFLAPTSWTAQVVMVPGLNNFTIAAYDAAGALVRGPVVVHGEYNGPVAEARDTVMITEIMYRASQPGAEYVELFNKASNFTFDLSGWRLDGLEFEFPAGAMLGPKQFLLVTKDQVTFGSAFAGQSAIYAYPGELDVSAETLSLLKGTTGEVIDRVRYESSAPWPPNANGRGSALQVVDMNEDNSRVSNWSDGLPWRYVTFTGTILGSALPTSRGTNFLIFLNLPGTVYIDDLVLVRGSVPEAGENVLANGGFEAPLEGTWIPVGNHSGSSRSTEVSHSGQGSLKVISTGVGSSIAHVRQVIPGNPTNAVYTLSFWLIPSTNAAQVTTRTAPGSGFIFQTPLMPVVATPGQSNSFVMDLPPYDPVWLNEVGTSGADSCAQWVELYNSGTNTVSLSNYELAGESLDPHTIAPGEFKVICLPAGELGAQRLTRTIGSMTQIVDYFNYASTPYGAVPDGQPFTRGPLRYPTEGKSNLSPRVASILRIGGSMYLTFQVTPGQRYRLEYKTDLGAQDWGVLDPMLVADEPELRYADTPVFGQRFYRLTLVP